MNASAAVPVAAAAVLHVAVAVEALLHTSRREGGSQGRLRKHTERLHPWQPQVAAVVGAAGHYGRLALWPHSILIDVCI